MIDPNWKNNLTGMDIFFDGKHIGTVNNIKPTLDKDMKIKIDDTVYTQDSNYAEVNTTNVVDIIKEIKKRIANLAEWGVDFAKEGNKPAVERVNARKDELAGLLMFICGERE